MEKDGVGIAAERTTPLGRLEVTDEVVAMLAARRALASPAITALARPNAGGTPLPPHRLGRAVAVTWSDGGLGLLLTVQVRPGTSARALAEAARQVRETAAAAVEVPVRVELRVVGLRGRPARPPTAPP
jgi:hypothetical protein